MDMDPAGQAPLHIHSRRERSRMLVKGFKAQLATHGWVICELKFKRYHEPASAMSLFMTRLLCRRLGAGPSSPILARLHPLRRVAPISGAHVA